MIEPGRAARVGGAGEQDPRRSGERIFHVLTTGIVRNRHSSLLDGLTPQVAIEDVADLPAVLDRLGRPPPPDLVMLDWEDNIDGDVDVFRRLHDHDTVVPLLIMRNPGHRAPSADAGIEPESLRLDVVRDAVVRLVTSIESLVNGTPMPSPRGMAAPAASAGVAVNPLDLRLDECRVVWRGRPVELSLTEFRVVNRLASACGAEVSHRDIYDVIKSHGFVAGTGDRGYRASVRATIKRIRQKFRQVDPGFAAIRSYPSFGYRWVVEMGSNDQPPTAR